MKALIAAVVAFVSGALVFCGLAWLGGYDFDHRSIYVAEGFFWILLLSIGAAVGAYHRVKKGSPYATPNRFGEPENPVQCEACHGTGTTPPPAPKQDINATNAPSPTSAAKEGADFDQHTHHIITQILAATSGDSMQEQANQLMKVLDRRAAVAAASEAKLPPHASARGGGGDAKDGCGLQALRQGNVRSGAGADKR